MSRIALSGLLEGAGATVAFVGACGLIATAIGWVIQHAPALPHLTPFTASLAALIVGLIIHTAGRFIWKPGT